MKRTLAAIAAALLATGARAQTPPAADAAAPAAAAPAKPKGTFVIGSKSQISINGRAWLEFNNVRTTAGAAANQKAQQNVSRFSNNASYLRIRGERGFMEGWKGVGQFEAEVGMDGEAGTPFSGTRNTFVGVESPFGDLQIGRYDSPAKETTIGRDPFGGTGIFGYYSVFSAYRADRRLNNAIMYTTPNMQGFEAMVAFSLGEGKFRKTSTDTTTFAYSDPGLTTSVAQTTTKTGTGQRIDPYTISGALHYRTKTPVGPLFAGVAYEYRNDCSNPDTEAAGGPSCNGASLGSDKAPNGTDQVIRFGADLGITQTFTKVAFVFDRVDAERPAKYGEAKLSLSRNAYWASITQGIMGNKHQLILNYGLADSYSGTPSKAGAYDNTGLSTFTAAYRYNIDADALFYVAVAQIANDKNQKGTFGSGSPPKTDGYPWAVPSGSTVTGFGAGFRYQF